MIHPLADVMSTKIGEHTRIWQFCVIFPDAEIGENCNICANVLIENKVLIGNNVTIKSGVQLYDGTSIEDNVFIGPNVTFTNDKVPRSRINDPSKLKNTLVKKGASIGGNTTILPGIEIGEFAFIGAGSVVTKNIQRNTLWYGTPFKQKGFITDDGILLNMGKRDKDGIYHELNL